MKTSERSLHDYVEEVSERTEVRSGVPLPLKTYEFRGRVNFAFFAPKAFYKGLRVRGILHTDYRSTCAKLASFGLQNDEGVVHETS
ncbi:MAG TPA: hypothetical protein VFZ27_14095 [Terriglobia bacterium]|nr:hypothetical protein [Terriglobia bacterium]